MPSEEPRGPHLEAIRRAFDFAREHGHSCGPVDFLVGISAGHGASAAALDPGQGQSLRAFAVLPDDPEEGAAYLHLQAQDGARLLASSLGQALDAEHLLVAVLDQGAPGVLETLSQAGLEPDTVRRKVLAAIGAPADQPPIPLPALAPAGTMDRRPLPVTDLDARAWTVLRWRQDHLPLHRLGKGSGPEALYHLERDAALRVAQALGLGDDQRYSLLSHHSSKVEQVVASGRPELVRPRRVPRGRRRHPYLRFTVGWGAWFRNRRVSIRDRWFRLRTIRHYRGCPQP